MNTNNARYLTFEEVSNLFVKTSYFEQLLRPCNSIVLGARGCGKTTLLKMLHPNAIFEYQKKHTDFDVPFYGVYIPSDRQWGIGLELIKKRTDISKALVNLNVLLAFLNTVNAIKSILELDEFGMMTFCSSLIKYWELNPNTTPAIELISMELFKYSITIKDYIGNSKSLLPYVCRFSFWDTLVIGINLLEMQFGSYSLKKRWALCFDEMELTPSWLQEEVMNEKLRNVNQKFLIKATGTPAWNIALSGSDSPTCGNDFEIIKCWNKDSTSETAWRYFCDKIIEKEVLITYGITAKELRDSITYIDTNSLESLIRELNRCDKGFANFFQKENYDIMPSGEYHIKALNMKSKKYMRAVLQARLEYYKNISKEKHSYKGYLGDFLLYKFADGNPRLFQNILGRIILNLKKNEKKRLKQNIPALETIIRNISTEAAFERLTFNTMPSVRIKGMDYSFPTLLDKLGDYFNSRLLSEKYDSSPVTMFEIKQNSPYVPFIKTGLESGTIIKIEDERRYSGKRRPVYRLSYVLYPYYGYIDTYSKEVELLDDIISKSNCDETE